ncbi:xylosyltransferase oxt [Tribolium castaneum]|uniref:protein xylosyltransferase n=1 Tax=Tribolium castaneum TaxID=7070 RepID=D7EJH3_TRICA|nr:PREDICTED: xylosyltransferase oxt [Tribolium castaneum]XP_969448.1 PREDICTED: xylosyltransferase oxt [Tribolium castaneum]EFA12734.1 Xylosyltransferase oxt-like Protein [Tribolium castaneum]|eukprot:XP_015840452.1 PREDICTED: xylosyltransferase oxt [Tribolium castaneum]
MVVSKGGNGRWLRKYKTFFLIGLIILLFQVLLAAHFLELKANSSDDWQPQSHKAVTQGLENHRKKLQVANTTALRLEELNFRPECEITGKEAVSAIHRAKSQNCKQLIANVTCKSLAGTLYPKRLTGSCPNGGKIAGKALGCFKDENNYRLLSGYFGVNKKSNSPEYCIQLCLQSGFEYAGVQYSHECFCGNDEPLSTFKLPDSSCNMKCPGDPHATCGGYYTINVFQTGIKKFVPQVANTESPPSHENVKIVFLLTLNGRALRQVKRLLKILYHTRHFYYIHVDVREDYLFRELLPLERRFPNIRLTRRRFATIWGGASLLEMLLSCMSELLDTPWTWDFVLNLSESDYPVKQISALERFLGANRDRNFVKSHGRDTQRFLQKQGLDKTFVECDRRMWRVADRRLPEGIQMDGGSDWIALSREFVSYVAKSGDDLVGGLRQVFRHTLLPAESFFHTVLRNSRFCDSYVDNNLHVTNWKRKLGCKCQYKHVVDWCGCSPNDFRPDDWARIQSTQPRQLFFARKFEPIINQAVLLKLELWLFGLDKPSRSVTNLHSYWQSVYHHLDLSPAIDDGLRTVTSSVGRVWSKTVTNATCSVTILRATSFHTKDLYKYTLVHFTTSDSADIEVAFRPINMTYLVAPSTLTKRIEELAVSSDYDQKEQISRNFPRILSPYSEPVLVYKFAASGASVTHNITCLWLDPIGQLVEISDISIEESALIGHSKPNLKHPHRPGSWTVKLIYHQTLLAEVKFLITPLEFYSGVPLGVKQARLIHGGSVSRPLTDNYDRFIENSDEGILKGVSVSNSNKTGKELQDWIDSLFSKFYVIEKSCAVGRTEVCGVQVEECRRTSWSSFAPDPKSFIGSVNETSGAFDIW